MQEKPITAPELFIGLDLMCALAFEALQEPAPAQAFARISAYCALNDITGTMALVG